MGHSLLETSARSFYAQQDARTPLYLAALNAALYVVLAISLSRRMGAVGIALANTLSFTSEALLLLFVLNRRFPGVLRVGGTLPRVALASLGGALLTYLLLGLTLPLPTLFLALGALAIGALVILPFIWPEIKILVQL